MIETMMRSLMPMLMIQVRAVPLEDKKQYAQFLAALLTAYIENRPDDFRLLISKVGLPEATQLAVIEALWHENPSR